MKVGIVVAVLVIAALVVAIVRYSIVFPRQPFREPLPALTESEQDLANRLRSHVTAIASTPHNLRYYANLENAAKYIEQTLRSFGHEPRSQIYEVDGRAVRNIEVVLEPTRPKATDGSYVVGAHYDSAGDAPGANDNGTGVAALMELARLFAGKQAPSTRLRLVFFVNEEPPYSWSEDMGSWRYAKSISGTGETIYGMISLETIGYFSDKPRSQRFPSPFGLIYPDKGNFVAFVGLPGSRRFVGQALKSFRRSIAFPSIGGVAPNFIDGIGWSDHWSFYQFGYPAFMITDTAPFRNPYYHRLNDLPQNVDYENLARVTSGLERVIRFFAFGANE